MDLRGKVATILVGAVALATAVDARSAVLGDPQLFPQRVLAAHNAIRRAAGVSPLMWDDQLGRDAASFALLLAMSGRFHHAPSGDRRGSGENLWMGSRNAFSVERMIGEWGSERRWFRPGRFPAVSTSGSWEDVGHYSQIVWPGTRRVGCALATNVAADILVCRYFPAGNIVGQVITR